MSDDEAPAPIDTSGWALVPVPAPVPVSIRPQRIRNQEIPERLLLSTCPTPQQRQRSRSLLALTNGVDDGSDARPRGSATTRHPSPAASSRRHPSPAPSRASSFAFGGGSVGHGDSPKSQCPPSEVGSEAQSSQPPKPKPKPGAEEEEVEQLVLKY